jgi:putative endonuclease
MASKPWFLYLIECQDGSIYTGITVDVEARYKAHQTGKGAKYTRTHPPKRLLKVVPFDNRSEASKAEYAVKQLSASEKKMLSISTDTVFKSQLNMPLTGLE